MATDFSKISALPPMGPLVGDELIPGLQGGATKSVSLLALLNYFIPVGTEYIQAPGAVAPASLYPGTTWSNVSSEESGLFRRIEGTNASAFGSGTQSGTGIGNLILNSNSLQYVDQDSLVPAANIGIGSGTVAYIGMTYIKTRPDNVTVRKWRRTA